MSNYLQDLNNDQRKAVEQTEGSKHAAGALDLEKLVFSPTKSLHLLKHGVNPFNILALTFTNKASKEMKERIDKIVGGNKSKSLWMGTFHSVFSRILRIESEKIHYPKTLLFMILLTQKSYQKYYKRIKSR